MSVPKKIHFIWLGKGKFTPAITQCIKSWKRVMPDYEIKCWNEDCFDLDSVPWVKEAIRKKKWSLASDYIRHYAIYNEGGIYLDTDVTTYRSFDDLLNYSFFTGIEYHPSLFNERGINSINTDGTLKEDKIGVTGFAVLAAAFGAEKGNPFIKECMDFFGSRHYIKEDGSLFEDIINPDIMAYLLIKYGFKYIDKDQHLTKNMFIKSSCSFVSQPRLYNKESYLIHWCDNSWNQNHLNWKGKLRVFVNNYFPLLSRKIRK